MRADPVFVPLAEVFAQRASHAGEQTFLVGVVVLRLLPCPVAPLDLDRMVVVERFVRRLAGDDDDAHLVKSGGAKAAAAKAAGSRQAARARTADHDGGRAHRHVRVLCLLRAGRVLREHRRAVIIRWMLGAKFPIHVAEIIAENLIGRKLTSLSYTAWLQFG